MTSKDLVAASARPLILAILARKKVLGYALLQDVKRLSRGELAWTDGMLYPVLHRLEREGLVLSRWRVSEAGRRRKYYRLSASGGREVETERSHWMSVHRTLDRAWRSMPCST